MPSAHDRYAQEYDDQVKIYDCHIADVLFGLSYDSVRPGDTLLDVGIGTGISSRLFKLAGLEIFGIDSSREMLNLCAKKGIAVELVEQDILVVPWPYPDHRFNHVICCGVFHFIGDLDRLFAEISRVQKSQGIFAFTVKDSNTGQPGQENYDKQTEDNIDVYTHRTDYIYHLLKKHHYKKEKEMIAFVGQTPFRTITARKGEA